MSTNPSESHEIPTIPVKEHPLIVFQRSKAWKYIRIGYWSFIILSALLFYWLIISTLF